MVSQPGRVVSTPSCFILQGGQFMLTPTWDWGQWLRKDDSTHCVVSLAKSSQRSAELREDIDSQSHPAKSGRGLAQTPI